MISIVVAFAVALLVVHAEATSEGSTGEICKPVEGLSFVCGLHQPEDAVRVSGTRWLVVSGMTPGSGLSAIDVDAKQAFSLYGPDTPARRDSVYPGCEAAPDPGAFSTHGLNLRLIEPGRFVLYVVSHRPGESIHVFTLDARGNVPALVWTGCIPIEGGYAANGVTSFGNGDLLATVYAGIERANGTKNGAVFSWKPGRAAFREIDGTALLSPNGLEVAADNSAFYVVSTIDGSFHVFSRDGRWMRSGDMPDYFPDNLRWSGNRLIAVGMRRVEPACGGELDWRDWRKRRDCNRGYIVAEVDPVGMTWRPIAGAEPNPAFSGVSTAVIVGDDLWLASWKEDRVGWRPLPGAEPVPEIHNMK